MKIQFLENEHWYGGAVHMGAKLPVGPSDDVHVRLAGGVDALDQYSPLFLSSCGRILHSNKSFDVHFNKGEIVIDDKFQVELLDGFKTLKGAALYAAKNYYAEDGRVPDLRFFKTPQYNTWIELMYNQNQEQILEYARGLIEGGMPAGVLMIDEGWSPDYGTYEFDCAKFSSPKVMIDELHAMGFVVMLWVTPMISPDSNCYRELRDTDILLRDKNGKTAIREWWNGFSAVLDFTNPKTREWFSEKLKALMDKYGVDGFKFDCGDTSIYRDDDKAYIEQEANAHTTAFNKFCEAYTFNELRNVWNLGGAPLVCRLQDKLPQWDETGLAALLPNMLTQGIIGYYFGCPDMVGGGAYGGFSDPNYKTDEELYLRWLSASILCPMMQFSISPKRILSPEAFAAVQKLSSVRAEYVEIIIELVKNAARNGEPALRYMEYEFPGCGYEKVTDQFMLGSDILAAPVLEKGARERTVIIPEGKWQSADGKIIEGKSQTRLFANVDELIILKRIK